MKALVAILATVAVSLALLAGTVFGLGDREILVPAPEAVAENFTRKLVTGRYSVALEQLDDTLRAQVETEALGRATRALKRRVGRIDDVRGEAGPIRGDTAAATAVLETARAGKVPLRYQLTWKQGGWAISDLGPLGAGE